MLLDAGADINTINAKKETVFAIAIRTRNTKLLEALVPKLSVDSDPALLFNFKGAMLLDEHYTKIIIAILKNKKPKSEIINDTADDGFTALLRFFKDYMDNYERAFDKVLKEVSRSFKDKGKQVENYAHIDNHKIVRLMDQEIPEVKLEDDDKVQAYYVS